MTDRERLFEDELRRQLLFVFAGDREAKYDSAVQKAILEGLKDPLDPKTVTSFFKDPNKAYQQGTKEAFLEAMKTYGQPEYKYQSWREFRVRNSKKVKQELQAIEKSADNASADQEPERRSSSGLHIHHVAGNVTTNETAIDARKSRGFVHVQGNQINHHHGVNQAADLGPLKLIDDVDAYFAHGVAREFRIADFESDLMVLEDDRIANVVGADEHLAWFSRNILEHSPARGKDAYQLVVKDGTGIKPSLFRKVEDAVIFASVSSASEFETLLGSFKNTANLQSVLGRYGNLLLLLSRIDYWEALGEDHVDHAFNYIEIDPQTEAP